MSVEKFALWRKDEEDRKAGNRPSWDEKITWRKAEVEALPLHLIQELTPSV